MLLSLSSDGVVRRAGLADYMEAVYALLNIIPPGFVVSYSDLAGLLGVSPRFIGFLLSLNRDLVVVPCHRVVRSDGGLGGYSGPGGVRFKRRVLELEGVVFEEGVVSRRCFVSLRGLLG